MPGIKQIAGLQSALDESVIIDPGYIPDVVDGEIAIFNGTESKEIKSSGKKIDDSAAASASVLWTSNKFGSAATKNVGSTSGTVCAGDDSRLGSVSDGAVTYAKLASSLVSRSALSGTSIDWSAAAIFTKTLSTGTTFTFSNLQLNKVITLVITGNYTLSLPSYCKRISGTYDGAVSNYIQLHCTNATSSSEEVWYTINQEAV